MSEVRVPSDQLSDRPSCQPHQAAASSAVIATGSLDTRPSSYSKPHRGHLEQNRPVRVFRYPMDVFEEASSSAHDGQRPVVIDMMNRSVSRPAW